MPYSVGGCGMRQSSYGYPTYNKDKSSNPHLGHGGFMMGAGARGGISAGLGQYGMPYVGATGATHVNWSLIGGGLLLLLILGAIAYYYWHSRSQATRLTGLVPETF